jgi:hypothetical protein
MNFFIVPTVTFAVLNASSSSATIGGAFWAQRASHKPVARPAIAGGLSVWFGGPVSHLRPGCEIGVGDCSGRSAFCGERP